MKKIKSIPFILIALFLICSFASSHAWAKSDLYPYPEIGDGQLATSVILTLVDGIVVDSEGNIYLSHRSKNRIRKIDKNGIITTIAGNGEAGFSGDGGPAIAASLNSPAGLAFDNEGNLFIADRNNHRIRKVTQSGIITTVAGNGVGDFSGDEGPAIEAYLNHPSDVACDDKGNLYISDRSNNRIRKVDSSGMITTYAGLGVAWYGGDFEEALDAFIKFPFGIHVDKNGDLLIADRGNNRIRKVNQFGFIATVAGDGLFASRGDHGPALQANLAYPTGVTTDNKGNIYIADRNNSRVRKVDTNGVITTIMGTGATLFNGDQMLAPQANLHLPFALAFDPTYENLYVVDRSHFRIRKLNFKNQRVETVAGNGKALFKGNEGSALGATLNNPSGIILDKDEKLIFADQMHNSLRKIDLHGKIFNFAGTGKLGNSGDGDLALNATLFRPSAITLDSSQNIFFVSRLGNGWNIRKIDRNGKISLYAGSAKVGTEGDNGPAIMASFYSIRDIAVDLGGNVYVADAANPFIRRINKNGIISKVAEKTWGALAGEIHPNGLAIDSEKNIFVSDSGSSKIWKIDRNENVTHFAGTGDFEDHGDGGPALFAGIRSPADLLFSPSGDLYILEERSHRIRKIDKEGMIHRVAGTGQQGFSGDGGLAIQAQLNNPHSMIFDAMGNLYFTDRLNNRIRRIDKNGIITTIAGSPHAGYLFEGLEVNLIIQNFP